MGAYEHHLAHHGVKGQKWGIRRYQNEDGTLTAEGRAKYGEDVKTFASRQLEAIKRSMINKTSKQGTKKLHQHEGRLQEVNDWEKAYKELIDKEKSTYVSKIEGQKKANKDIKKYQEETSAGKLIWQKALLGKIGSTAYQTARGRGATRLQAMLELVTPGLHMYKNKKAYGSVVVHSDTEGPNNEVI